MPRYQLQVDELQRIRREYVVEADDVDAARDLAEAGNTVEETDDGLPDVVERFVVPDTLIELPQHTYEIEQYELHAMAYRVKAYNEAEAIESVLDGEGEAVDLSLEFIQVDESRGLAADDHVDLCSQLRSLAVSVKEGVIPSIRSIRLVDEPKDSLSAILEAPEKEPPCPAPPASHTYRVRYEIDVDAGNPLAAARQAYAHMVSPDSYRPVLEVALHRNTGEVDFSIADTFDLDEVGCRDDMALQLELVAEIIESTYPHDASGRRVEGDSPISGADVVERLTALEQPIRDILHRHAELAEVSTGRTEAIRVPSLCVVLESEPHGREMFSHYGDLEGMLTAVRRMVASSLEQTTADGIERTVGIAIIPPSDDEEDENETDYHSPR